MVNITINNQNNRLQQQQNTVKQLRNVPQCPVFPAALPDSMVDLLFDHVTVYKLTKYMNKEAHVGWDVNLKNQFHRRNWLYLKIRERAHCANF